MIGKTILPLLLTIAFPFVLFAQKPDAGPERETGGNRVPVSLFPTLQAHRMESPDLLVLDGRLDEGIWSTVPAATGFVQRTPRDGAPASERTEVRVIYSDDALYIGAKAYDSAMDSVAATLFRRDGSAYSDWIYVNIDSYDDDRTSFSFAVNPRGVRKDLLTYDDSNENLRWDAVWEAQTAMEADGWTVEMRIPLSQLRFDAGRSAQNWGINFQRRLARKQEISYWSPTPRDGSGLVSRYGTLQGIRELDKPANLEITPYSSASLTRAPGSASNPFYRENSFSGGFGADLTYGLTSDFNLTATINPDFGQVEADPAVINLSAFETFYPEQRPFFLEGTDIFQFGRTRTHGRYGNPEVFYSRRIGRQPRGEPGMAGLGSGYSDIPDQTTIAGAAKFSGKTDRGFSLGLLNAFTLREKASYLGAGGSEARFSVEPPTNYFVGRVKQDFNRGNTVAGGYLSAVNRFIGADYLAGHLHENAYVGGVDFEHSWDNRKWSVSGVLSGSSVTGTPEALERTQRSSARYYDRVDADYLSVDPRRTQLGGLASELSFGRFGGKHWRASITHSMVTPGYEVNDMGFEKRADYNALVSVLLYQENTPGDLFRSFHVGAYSVHAWNFGGDRISNGYNLISSFQFHNLWRFHFNAGYNGSRFSDRLLRGGPLAATPSDRFYSGVLQSNSAKALSVAVGHLRKDDSSGGKERDLFAELTLRPTSYIQLSLGPSYNYRSATDQYVTAVSDERAAKTYGRRYVLADIDRRQLSMGVRVDWTFTPNMTLQAYARPYIAGADFRRYKEFRAPGAFDFDVYGRDKGSISRENGVYTVDPDAEGPAAAFRFQDRDFNFRSVQTNMVFRWEYQPGSTFYLVWQQDRSSFGRYGDLRLNRDLEGLADTKPTNVFLVKMSYWFGS